MNFDAVEKQLNLVEQLDDSSILKHFEVKLAFKEFRSSWSSEATKLFCRLIRIVHSAGLDCWHVNIDVEVRFGRKPRSGDAAGVLGVLRGKKTRTLSLLHEIGSLTKLHRRPLNEELVQKLENAILTNADFFENWLPTDSKRRGFWPDELIEESVGSAEGESEDVDDTEDEKLIDLPMRLAFNRIYYGPPGTGKTYRLQQLLDEKYTQQAATLSAVELTEQKIAQFTQDLKWWEVLAAALYSLGGTADVSALMQHPYVQAVIAAKQRTTNVRQTIWGSLQQHAPEESKTVKTKGRIAPFIFDKSESSVWSFAGDWKDQCAELIAKVDAIKTGSIGASEKICRYEFVTFHQSYGYEEFVEGLRPVLAEPGDETGDVKYHIPGGAFLRLCEKARKNPTYHYAMVIDEINRGNVSKIFGELITLIEIDKREGAKYPASVTLPYSGNPFSVPANVDVIGTMNTADRSLALVDTALRRRFDFVEIMPDARDVVDAPLYQLSVESAGLSINIPRMLAVMNKRIEALYDRDHTIGHAYFIQLIDLPATERFATLQAIFKNKIIPLLEEYFFEDWQKIRLVLGDNQKSDEQLQFIQEINQEDDLAELFGQKHDLDQYAIRPRYQFNSSALSQMKAYLGIYGVGVEAAVVE
jgi:5-methylcytosine-specific restriction protein B